jgi:hypothetical protein
VTLNPSGPISLGGTGTNASINLELGLSATAQISLNDTAVRTLAGVASGAIIVPTDFYNKSVNASYSLTTGSATYNYGFGLFLYAYGYSNSPSGTGSYTPTTFGSITPSTFNSATIKAIYSTGFASNQALYYYIIFSGSRGTGFFNTLTINGTLVSGSLSSSYNGTNNETTFFITLASSAATLMTAGTKTILLT